MKSYILQSKDTAHVSPSDEGLLVYDRFAMSYFLLILREEITFYPVDLSIFHDKIHDLK